MGQAKHILVVDDDSGVRNAVVNVLLHYDYRVSSVSGGASMRDSLSAGESVDCVVLDVLMPGEANISLLLHLKDLGLPVVVISGSPEAMTRAEEYNLQLLRKP